MSFASFAPQTGLEPATCCLDHAHRCSTFELLGQAVILGPLSAHRSPPRSTRMHLPSVKSPPASVPLEILLGMPPGGCRSSPLHPAGPLPVEPKPPRGVQRVHRESFVACCSFSIEVEGLVNQKGFAPHRQSASSRRALRSHMTSPACHFGLSRP